MWRARRWRLLLNLIDHLPRHSFYVEALLNDGEFCAQVLQRSSEQVARERVSEWTPEREALAQVVDQLKMLTYVLVKVNSGDPPAPEPTLRPVTAADGMRTEIRKKQHRELLARFGVRSSV